MPYPPHKTPAAPRREHKVFLRAHLELVNEFSRGRTTATLTRYPYGYLDEADEASMGPQYRLAGVFEHDPVVGGVDQELLREWVLDNVGTQHPLTPGGVIHSGLHVGVLAGDPQERRKDNRVYYLIAEDEGNLREWHDTFQAPAGDAPFHVTLWNDRESILYHAEACVRAVYEVSDGDVSATKAAAYVEFLKSYHIPVEVVALMWGDGWCDRLTKSGVEWELNGGVVSFLPPAGGFSNTLNY